MEYVLSEAAQVCAPEARQIFGVLHAAQSVVHRSRTAFSLKQLKSAPLRHAKILVSFMLPNLLYADHGQLPFKSARFCAPEARKIFGVLHAVQSVYTDHGQLRI